MIHVFLSLPRYLFPCVFCWFFVQNILRMNTDRTFSEWRMFVDGDILRKIIFPDAMKMFDRDWGTLSLFQVFKVKFVNISTRDQKQDDNQHA